MAAVLPALAPFPSAALRGQIPSDEWATCLNSWVVLLDGHLSLSDALFSNSVKDDSLVVFLTLFIEETAAGGVNVLGSSPAARKLMKSCFLLV